MLADTAVGVMAALDLQRLWDLEAAASDSGCGEGCREVPGRLEHGRADTRAHSFLTLTPITPRPTCCPLLWRYLPAC